ncbi:hypothetical protein Curi_c25020 [Gottschalkia acidurici 9a]|uniref:DUF4956 domain-containing protein n=1 Tax=Gottschalkia acidurici (strain ATCC 7906 / DSM 604 / BCRC 14475 / CIP 104303 / KCTC 5404 / NCIMB 10678 / 9a) TaxID=1128398 RepID=K0B2W6_GOTA9|nr:DUF4956 domain-containing protein [Gottschalkia acidurici]AFS79497.1 hypothetical protein Curi_c25020 [Gottschalkia acidurici 9a]
MDNTFTFSDIFKKSFLNSASNDLTAMKVVLTLGLTFLIGLFIYVVYKKTFKGVLFSKSFNVSLIAISMVTSLVIMAVTSNVVLSLGMVGALSIVRFRTAIKDPVDIVFMFWSISVGIVTGASLYVLAIFGSLVIGIILVAFNKTVMPENAYLFVVNCNDSSAEDEVIKKIRNEIKKFNIKSKTVTKDSIEMTLELRVKDNETGFVNMISNISGVSNAVLISYNGDYVS